MIRLKKIVVATRNPAKKERFKRLLGKIAEEALSLEDFNFVGKPEESGGNAEENAKIKALYYFKNLNLPVFSEDESLFVDFLPAEQQPGVFVRRVNGKELSDQELLSYWKSIISKVPKEKRSGRWHIAYCLVGLQKEPIIITIDHPIIFFDIPLDKIPTGWPLNNIQGPVKFGKPESELTTEELKEHEKEAEIVLMQKLRELS